MIDTSEPILGQLWSEDCTREDYLKWVHKPIQGSVCIFRSDWLEMLSKTPYYIVPLVWIPYICSIWMQYASEFTFSQFLLIIVLGTAVWPVFEYSFHRFLFHATVPEHKAAYCLHFLLHGIHHLTPHDSLRLVMPPLLFWCLIFPVRIVLLYLLPEAFAWVFISGSLIGYIYYDLIHYYLHHGHRGFRVLRKHHSDHHFRDSSEKFGVSSKCVDWIVGT